MTDQFMTYALWGNGDLDEKNARAVLEEYIPDNVGTIYRPERVTRDQAGLRTALSWFESPDFLGDGGAMPTTDVVQSLVEDRENNGDEVHLLALWPDAPALEDFALVESAQNAGITVLDLSRAMDELDLSLYERPKEKAPAKAPAAKKPRTRKIHPDDIPGDEAGDPLNYTVPAGYSDADNLPDKVAFAAGPSEETLKRVAAKTTSVKSPEPVVTGVTPRDEVPVQSALFLASVRLTEAIDAYIEAKVNAYLDSKDVTTIPAGSTVVPVEAEDRPPFDGPYITPDTETEPYFRSATTGKFRLAKGKPRRGETVYELTAAEVRDYTISGLL